MRAPLAGILSLACLSAATCRLASAAPADPGAPLLAHRLVDGAYDRSRATGLPPALAAEEAEILLQAARSLEPENLHTLKLLVEAAGSAGDTDAQRDALRTVIRLDPGDLVAQVQYIDLLASASQAIDERARIYQAALSKNTLDPQIRSEMAIRLARISTERANPADARTQLQQALALNNVNVNALRETASLAKTPEERIKALVALLNVDSLEPDAWVEMGRILEAAGLPSQAADTLGTALEQMAYGGEQAPGDIYLAFGLDMAIAGRRVDATVVLQRLAAFPDAPLSALVAAHLLAEELQAGKPETAETQPADKADLPTLIRKRLADEIKAAPDSPAPLSDAIWIELSAMTPPAPQTADWLKAYSEKVPADDPALARFHGWQLFRDGKLADAEAALAKIAPADPLAQLGFVRVLLAEKKMAEASRELQDLWWAHPTGLLGLEIAQAARASGLKLADTIPSQKLLATFRDLGPAAATTHREPRDSQLISANLSRRAYDVGEPVVLNVRITNTTDHPLPVGSDGVVKTTIGLTAKISGTNSAAFGLYGVDDLRRVYRLEPRSTIEGDLRVDRGILADALNADLLHTMTVTLGMITAPRGSMRDAVPSLGGQLVPIGDFSRRGVQLRSPEQLQTWLKEVTATASDKTPSDKTLVDAAYLTAALRPVEGTASTIDPALRTQIVQALTGLLQSPSPVTRASLVLLLPTAEVSDFDSALAGLHADADPLVRMMWARRQLNAAAAGGSKGSAAQAALQQQAQAEQDPLAKRWMNALLKEKPADSAPAPAATQP